MKSGKGKGSRGKVGTERAAAKGAAKSKVKRKAKAIDFDDSASSNSDDADDADDADDGGLTADEMRAFKLLKLKLMRCVLCGDKFLCILIGARHYRLTWQQLRTWAIMLVRSKPLLVCYADSSVPQAAKVKGTSETRPPDSSHFTEYWQLRNNKRNFAAVDTDETVPTPPAPAQSVHPHPSYPPYYGPPFPGYYPPPVGTPTPQRAAPRASPAAPSSDPPDAFAVSIYSTIEDFFTALHAVPRFQSRNLPHWSEVFQARGYDCIEELSGFTVETLMDKFAIPNDGDAGFILQKIKDEITAVDKRTRREKRAKRG